MLLGVDRGGTVELGGGDRRGGVGGGRVPLVPGGGRDATIDARAVVEAALGAMPVARGARGDRAVACAGAWGAGGRPAAGAGGVDDLARVAAECRDPQRRAGVPRHDGAVACRAGGAAPGPAVPWKGRRHGPRQPRRWARAWSPQQISRRLRLDFPGDGAMRISHEAIYQSLYVQGRGALRRELTACLRTGRALRVPRARTRGRGKSHVGAEVKISERPAEADDRAVPGHWEGDLILGLGSSAI